MRNFSQTQLSHKYEYQQFEIHINVMTFIYYQQQKINYSLNFSELKCKHVFSFNFNITADLHLFQFFFLLIFFSYIRSFNSYFLFIILLQCFINHHNKEKWKNCFVKHHHLSRSVAHTLYCDSIDIWCFPWLRMFCFCCRSAVI